MDAKQLQKKIIVRGAVYLASMIAIIVIAIYLGNTKTKFEERGEWLKNDTFSLKRKLEGLSKKALEFSEAVIIWEGLSEAEQKLQGLRINYAKDFVDGLKEAYKLSDLNISFSKPEEHKEGYLSDTVATITSDVNISFKSLNDEYALNFIGALLEDFPGYVQIKSLSITRSKEITKKSLERIAAGDFPGLVDGKIDFKWSDLKYKGPAGSGKEGR